MSHETKNIMFMYKSILRPWLFRIDAEKIHNQIMGLLHVYRHLTPVKCLVGHTIVPRLLRFNGGT